MNTARPRNNEWRLRSSISVFCAVSLFVLADGADAQEETFVARLSTVPINSAMRTLVTGRGEAVASLSGRQLSVTGRFEGLQRPANLAQLRLGPVMGVKGEPIFDVVVTNAVRGSLEVQVELSNEQIEALRDGRIYIQIHSESAPDGNLWGWLVD